MESGHSIKIKVVLIGEGGVGKTSIARRYLEKGYKEEYLRTVGANFYTKKIAYDLEIGKTPIQWLIWDLAGQPTFDEVRGMYYRKAKAALVVYDISRPETYYNLPNWISEFWENSSGQYPLVLVANKIDLRGTDREEIPRSSGAKYARILSQHTGYNIPFVETSAKDDVHINDIFTYLAHLIIEWAKRASRR
ncbi:MAG: GTP-binding protein [Candidatus Korarchaeota archaeon]|nr:GTP-binding protein [Candidatus Korarchaeota archaeon]NIU82665.1 GTP-binding protein [Candidatus Thorarchaeota archaeon]NIW13144.1 GTP-binding protein [Candidatus Thorarchaeota archaeon]NIW51298.1 GTP-binding protein [Candidatus Korarchaeota archaeon]